MLTEKRTHPICKAGFPALILLIMGLLLTSSMKVTAAMPPHQPQEDRVYKVIEVMPEFPGGTDKLMDFISKNISYPEEAQKKKIQGKVVVTYIVEKDGSITSPEVVVSVNDLLDKEALRVISLMPKWTPGKHKGQNVRVQYTLPMMFKLE